MGDEEKAGFLRKTTTATMMTQQKKEKPAAVHCDLSQKVLELHWEQSSPIIGRSCPNMLSDVIAKPSDWNSGSRPS